MERKPKDSGIPWIGLIPEHWEVKPIGAFFKENVRPNSSLKSTNQLQFKMGNIIPKKIGDSKYNPETLEGYNIVSPGDIMINGLNLSFDYISQRVALVRENGVITSTYLSISPKQDLSTTFYTYLLKSYDNQKVFHSWGKGLRATLSYSILKGEMIPVPPLEEQERIAGWLDEKCGEIDELIEVEQQMIADLEAYRQAVITEAVTHGINNIAQTKESSIPWLRKIPEHWEEIRLKFLTRISTGDKDTIMADPEGTYPFFVRSPKVERINTYSYDGEAILMAGDGVGAGRVFHHYTGKFDWHQRVYNLHDLSYKIYGTFLYYFLQSNFYKLIDAGSAKSTVDSVRLPMLTNFIIAVPPFFEQREIGDYLDAKCTEIDELVKVKQEKIEILKEYRQSLIFEAVTGKIVIE